MNAPFAPPALGTTVLRVLNGRLAGAEYRLHDGKFVRVGHSFDHDIVLRDPSTRGLSLELHLGGEVATVRVVAGQVGLFGRPVVAGEEAALPAYVPLSLGSFTVGIGDAESDRWDETARLSTLIAPANAANAVESQRAGLSERFATRLYPMRDSLSLERRWPVYAVAAALLLLVVALAGPTARWVTSQFANAEVDSMTLAAAGFGKLTVTDTPNGPMIRGIVKDDAELARLRNVVADRIGRATVDVDTMQALAASATDLLRAQGIDGEARPMRGTNLLINAEYLPADRQDEIAKLIRSDVPGIGKVNFTTDNARGDKDLQYFFSGSEYGLATFVDGSPGYITTADGTRWFAGAQVPTGHKIIAIGNGRASFERGGRVEELLLGAPQPPASSADTRIGGQSKEGTQS